MYTTYIHVHLFTFVIYIYICVHPYGTYACVKYTHTFIIYIYTYGWYIVYSMISICLFFYTVGVRTLMIKHMCIYSYTYIYIYIFKCIYTHVFFHPAKRKMVEAMAIPLHSSVFPQVLPLHFQMPPATRFTFSWQIPTYTGTVPVLFSKNQSDDMIFTQAKRERTMYLGATMSRQIYQNIWNISKHPIYFCQIPHNGQPQVPQQHGPCRRRSTCSGHAAGSRSAWWSSYTDNFSERSTKKLSRNRDLRFYHNDQ